MEKSFDFGRLLKNHEKKHKVKPAQFISVAGGVQKRLETNLKHRKSSRLTVFDSIRNLSRCESPVAVAPTTKSKEEHRRQQLEKWKEEKEKRKKEAAAQKKKPFVAGVPHAPLKFVPPPPPPKPMPSTSGRVTRSQSAKQQNVKQKVDTKQKFDTKISKNHSFAPKNASFQPPKNLMTAPTLAPLTKNKKQTINFVFNPVLPNEKQVRATRSRNQVAPKITTETTSKTTRKNAKDVDSKKAKITKKPSPKIKRTAKTLQSSSSSEVDTASSTEKSPVFKVKTPRKSLQRESNNFTPKNPVPKSESSSEERLRSPKSPVDIAMTPEQIAEEFKKISPRVTMSRGKDNARKEMKKKLEEGLLDEDASDMDSVVHFRQQLDSEIKRMTEMCVVWEKIQEQTQLSEYVQELVLGALGQARLLMAAKLQQFAALVERCARPRPGDGLVTPADLQGFWDMVFMQVENIDMRFKKLEELRARNWVEEQPEVAPKRPVVRNHAKKAAPKPAGGPSRLREMIAAARKAKKQQEDTTAPEEPASKTFEAGFFCVKSPVRSPAQPATPARRHSLLKSVLSSEAKKSASKSAASFAMLRASVLSRNIDEGIAPLPPSPLTPINFHATPARSILKSAKVASEKKTGKKSIKVVLFDQDDNEPDPEIEGLINGVSKLSELADSKLTELDTKLSEVNADSGISSMDVEKEADVKENKENTSRRRGRLVRQDATTEDKHVVMTRSRRKSANAAIDNEDIEEKTPRRSSRKKKALQEMDAVENVLEDRLETPRRTGRSRKSGLQLVA